MPCAAMVSRKHLDGFAGDGRVGDAGEEVAGVVVEDVEDLHIADAGQAPVGEVGLPGLVRQFGSEPAQGRLRAALTGPG